MTSIKCNLCGQEFNIDNGINVNDVWGEDVRKRMTRHKERHNPIGRTASSNIIRGEVEWIVIDWEEE